MLVESDKAVIKFHFSHALVENGVEEMLRTTIALEIMTLQSNNL